MLRIRTSLQAEFLFLKQLYLMRIVLLIALCLLTNSVFGQPDPPKPTVGDEREAKVLAAKFFSRFQETQDLSPLLDEFFIKDFSTRLKFCGNTDECGGFAKDFWGKNEELSTLKSEERDFQRLFVNTINNLYLTFRSLNYMANSKNKEFPDLGSDEEKELVDKVKAVLKDDAHLIHLGFFSQNSDTPPPVATTLIQFRRRMADFEKLNQALRTVASGLREDRKRLTSETDLAMAPRSFEIDLEENTGRFFNYPVGTRMIEVWPDEIAALPFKMDLIRVGGKLKIVAIYPPMD